VSTIEEPAVNVGIEAERHGYVTVAPDPEIDRHSELGLTPEQLLEMYCFMRLARAVDERMWVLNRAGLAAFVISGQGHEAAQVGTVYALRRGHDFLCPYYRDLAAVLVFGMTPAEMLMALLARAADPNSGGRQMPAHWGAKRLNIVSQSSVVGTQLLHACGAALAAKMRGEDSVAFASFGEGSASEGDFHEACNFASIWRLGCLFLCENNRYAISEPSTKQMAIENLADRALGYGFPGIVVDGNDVLEVYRVAQAAVARARRGEGPTLIEAKTYRLTPHSSDDDDRIYRSREEVAEWRSVDPIGRFQAYLQAHGILDEALDAQLKARIAREVDEATEEAERAPQAAGEAALRHVFAEDSRA
jgi:2-oxoisovalerate dehydrogenase E1 component alpha subunit